MNVIKSNIYNFGAAPMENCPYFKPCKDTLTKDENNIVRFAGKSRQVFNAAEATRAKCTV